MQGLGIFQANMDGPWNKFDNFWWVTKSFLMGFPLFFSNFPLKSTQVYDKCFFTLRYKTKTFDVFSPCCCSFRHCNGAKDICLYDKFSWGFFIFLTPLFQWWFGLISCIIFMKEFISLTMVAIEIGKRQFLNYYSKGCNEEKKFHQKFEPSRFKLPLKELDLLDQCRVR